MSEKSKIIIDNRNKKWKEITDNRNRIAELLTKISEAEYENAQLLKELNRVRAILGEPPK